MTSDQPEYIVLRHSGRFEGQWRVVIQTQDTDKALQAYIKDNLRQGAVVLKMNDVELERTSAPRLRTRW